MKPSGKIGTVGCNLSENELERYSRQIMLSDNEVSTQLLLKRASVLVIGAGGLSSSVLPYLAGAGVGNIAIVDDDIVSLSNLQRQILYSTEQLGQPKAIMAKQRLESLNSEINVVAFTERLTEKNAVTLFMDKDVIVDCTDNLASRYLIDTYSRKLGIPFVYGGVQEYMGQVAVFNYKNGCSFADVYPYSEKMPPHPQGIYGASVGIVGAHQAMEVIKILTHKEEFILSGKILIIDTLKNKYRTVSIQ